MRRPRRRMRSGAGAGFFARLLTFLAVLLIAAVLVDMRIRPVVEEVLAYQAQAAAFRVMNSAMLEELARMGVDYGDIALLSRGADGSVTSIQTKIVTVNSIKSRLSDAVINALEEPGNQRVLVPVGTLLGGNITSGRGPSIEVRLMPLGYVQSELYNEFTSAGINQTLHRIMLETTVQTSAVLPGYTVRTRTAASFCIAETVIVGAVPEGYTIVGEDGRSVISKVNDYQAG